MNERRRSLGRGLSALFQEQVDAPFRGGELRVVPIEHLRPSKVQPRRSFEPEHIATLTESIREKGVLQPILVRPLGGVDRFEIVAGERRWRAAQAVPLHEVPVIVRQLSDRGALEIALVENVQRQNLTPIEEAEGYGRLRDEFNYSQEALAKVIGKSRSHIANMLRLLGLPEPVRRMVDAGELTAGHARALLTAAEPEALARQIVARGLNVRQTEQLAQDGRTGGKTGREPTAKSADVVALERELTDLTGLRAGVAHAGPGGSLTFRYDSLEQLDAILAMLRAAKHSQPS